MAYPQSSWPQRPLTVTAPYGNPNAAPASPAETGYSQSFSSCSNAVGYGVSRPPTVTRRAAYGMESSAGTAVSPPAPQPLGRHQEQTDMPLGPTVSRPAVPANLQVHPPAVMATTIPPTAFSPLDFRRPEDGKPQQGGLDGSLVTRGTIRSTVSSLQGRLASPTGQWMGESHLGGCVGDQQDISDEDELPLLEELGINPERICKRMKSALLFYKLDHDLLVDVDMCGPLFIVACLGCCLLLSGKIHFGYIYGLSVTGCIGICILLNLMSQKGGIDFYSTLSILGYGLMPVVGLACVAIFFSLRTLIGTILSVLCVLWCTSTASRFFETALEMTHQRFLVAYPISLIYGCFVLITVF